MHGGSVQDSQSPVIASGWAVMGEATSCVGFPTVKLKVNCPYFPCQPYGDRATQLAFI